MTNVLKANPVHRSSTGLSSVGRILKARHYDAHRQAEQILRQVEDEAQLLRDIARREANAEAERILAAAHTQAQELIAQQVQAEVSRISELLQATEESIAALSREWEQKLLDLAVRMAGRIINEELRTDPNAILWIIREAVRSLRKQRTLQITIHPAHAELLRARMEALRQFTHGTPSIEIVSDAAVGYAGCQIQCDWGEIDARLDTQLNAFRDALSLPKDK